MKRGTPTHIKTKRLVKASGVGLAAVLGHLELLWHTTARLTPAGDIGKYADQEIEEEIAWEGEPGKFIAALLETGWLERHPQHRIIVHDWHEHADDTTKKHLRRNNLDFVQTCPDTVWTCPDIVQTVSDVPSTHVRLPMPMPLPMPEPEPEPEPRPEAAQPQAGEVCSQNQHPSERLPAALSLVKPLELPVHPIVMVRAEECRGHGKLVTNTLRQLLRHDSLWETWEYLRDHHPNLIGVSDAFCAYWQLCELEEITVQNCQDVRAGHKRYQESDQWERGFVVALRKWLIGDDKSQGRMWRDHPKPSAKHTAEAKRGTPSSDGINPHVEWIAPWDDPKRKKQSEQPRAKEAIAS